MRTNDSKPKYLSRWRTLATLGLSGLVSVAAPNGWAGTVNLTGDNTVNESWLTTGDWTPEGVPTNGNDYVVSSHTIRSPGVAGPVFNGDSLTLNSGGILAMKHTSTMTVADLRLNGGELSTYQNVDVGVTGRVTVSQNSLISFNGNTTRILLSSTLSGSSALTLTQSAAAIPVLFLLADNPEFSGAWTVGSGITLQVGNGGASGTLGWGNVTNNGTLIFNRSNEYVVSNMLAGVGGLLHSGGGTTTLAATNSYSGDTVVTNGTLRLFQPYLPTNAVIKLVTPGVLELGYTGTNTICYLYTNGVSVVPGVYGAATLPGKLSGGGFLRVLRQRVLLTGLNWAGQSWLTPENWTPSGAATNRLADYEVLTPGVSLRSPASLNPVFEGGSLFLSTVDGALRLKHTGTATIPDLRLNGGEVLNYTDVDLGLAGNIQVMANSSLTINDGAWRLFLSSTFSGQANLTVKRGTTAVKPFVILLSDNPAYTGNWTINAGAGLQLGTNSTAGTLGSGTVTNNGILVFNRADAITVNNLITGPGCVTNLSGAVTLQASNTYTGQTVVAGGVLVVNGSLTNVSVVTVLSGASLGGTGQVGVVTVKSGGSVTGAGTNVVGTLKTTTLTLEENAKVVWNYDTATGTADSVTVSGALTLPAVATVVISGTGDLPLRKLLFSAGSRSGASSLNAWAIQGGKATTAVISGNNVWLETRRGTMIQVF